MFWHIYICYKSCREYERAAERQKEKGVYVLHIDKVEYESQLTNALVLVYQHRLFVDKLGSCAAADLALPMLNTHY